VLPSFVRPTILARRLKAFTIEMQSKFYNLMFLQDVRNNSERQYDGDYPEKQSKFFSSDT